MWPGLRLSSAHKEEANPYAHSAQRTSFGQVGTGPRTSSSVGWRDGDALNHLEEDGVGSWGRRGGVGVWGTWGWVGGWGDLGWSGGWGTWDDGFLVQDDPVWPAEGAWLRRETWA